VSEKYEAKHSTKRFLTENLNGPQTLSMKLVWDL